MKRILAVVGIILIFGVIVVSNRLQENRVIVEFNTLVAKDNVTPAELIGYIDENINVVSKQQISQMVLGLEAVQKASLTQWQQRFEKNELQIEIAKVYRNGLSKTDVATIQAAELKEIVLTTLDNGYKVETAEGFYFPVIDYAFYQKYHNAVTPDLAAYLEIMAVESNETPIKDAALMIGWDEIVRRALRQEQFIKQYNTSPLVGAMQQVLKRYVSFALFGANNTPLFCYNSRQMEPEAKRVYLEESWDKDNGSFSALMVEYLEVLKKNDYRLTSEVDVFRKKIINAF